MAHIHPALGGHIDVDERLGENYFEYFRYFRYLKYYMGGHVDERLGEKYCFRNIYKYQEILGRRVDERLGEKYCFELWISFPFLVSSPPPPHLSKITS